MSYRVNAKIRKFVYNALFYFKNRLFMYKYDGLLIHESHDDDGILEVVDCAGIRTLHFGSAALQSSMALARPEQLQLAYTRAMTSYLLFKPDLLDEALLLGLGGGSLAKHLLHHFPDCRLQVVEYRKSVVKIARSYFGLPLDPRLKVIVGEGAQAVRQRAETQPESFGVVFVDAFDHEGMAQPLRNQAFFDACRQLLKPDGMMVINLWGGLQAPDFIECANWLGTAFGWRVLFLPVKDRSNIIGLAFNSEMPLFDFKTLKQQAAELEHLYQIDYPVFLQDIKRHNTSTFKHIFKS
ncbi:fused MFS/spermidine synthase [Methylosoma difficile]